MHGKVLCEYCFLYDPGAVKPPAERRKSYCSQKSIVGIRQSPGVPELTVVKHKDIPSRVPRGFLEADLKSRTCPMEVV